MNSDDKNNVQSANNKRIAFHEHLKTLLLDSSDIVEADLLVTNAFFVQNSVTNGGEVTVASIVKVITDIEYRDKLLNNPALSLTKMTFDKFDSMDTVRKEKILKAIVEAGSLISE